MSCLRGLDRMDASVLQMQLRKEGKRERSAMLREIREAQLKDGKEMEDLQQRALEENRKALAEQLANINFPTKTNPLFLLTEHENISSLTFFSSSRENCVNTPETTKLFPSNLSDNPDWFRDGQTVKISRVIDGDELRIENDLGSTVGDRVESHEMIPRS